MNLHLAVATLLGVVPAGAVVTIIGPIPYRQRSDSPFYQGIVEGTIYLEDFEDGLLSPPGVTVSSNTLILRDRSVDEDDGMLDNLGRGRVLAATSYVFPSGEPWLHEITFSPDPMRGYPTYVGFALLGFTDPPQLITQRLYQGFDSTGADFSGIIAFDVPHLSNSTPEWSTEGDQFAGFYNDQGISRVLIGGFAGTLDHLQYGWAVPEPGAAGLALAAGLVTLIKRRRGH